MKYGYLGKSNLEVSKVCLGTMHIGNRVDDETAFRIMDKAVDMGINFFDTANIYGAVPGQTEDVIGRWMKQGNRRDKIVLTTKGYQNLIFDRYVPNESDGISMYKFRRTMEDSLRRLQTDHVDIYQIHHLDRRVSVEEFWETMERLIDKDYTSYVGTSNFSGWGLAKFQMAAKARGRVGIVSEQTMYNLLCRYSELEVIPAAQDLGIGVMAYMPMAGGLLAGKTHDTAGFRTNQVVGEYNIPYEQNEMLDKYQKMCAELGEKPSDVACAWVLGNPGVSTVVVGVRTMEHLEALDHVSELVLPEDFRKDLDELFHIDKGRGLRNNLPMPEAYAW